MSRNHAYATPYPLPAALKIRSPRLDRFRGPMININQLAESARWESRLVYPHLLLEALASQAGLEYRILRAVLGHSDPPSINALPATLGTAPEIWIEHLLGDVPPGFACIRREVFEAVAVRLLYAIQRLEPLLSPETFSTLHFSASAFNNANYPVVIEQLHRLTPATLLQELPPTIAASFGLMLTWRPSSPTPTIGARRPWRRICTIRLRFMSISPSTSSP